MSHATRTATSGVTGRERAPWGLEQLQNRALSSPFRRDGGARPVGALDGWRGVWQQDGQQPTG